MGTITKGLIGKQDMRLWDGTSSGKTFSRLDSNDNTLTLNSLDWVGVDVLQVYGGGVNRTKATLASALADVGSSNNVTFWLSPGTWTIDDDLTITSNIHLVCPAGVTLSISSGKTLTIDGTLEAGRYQIFDGDGDVSFGDNITVAYPEWWGADPTGSTASASSVNKALQSGAKCTILSGVYLIDEPIRVNGYMTLRGEVMGYSYSPYNYACLIAADGLNDNIIESYFNDSDNGDPTKWLHQTIIERLAIYGNKANQTSGNGIYLWQPGENTILRDIKIRSCKGSGIKIDGQGNPNRLENISSFDNDRYGVEIDGLDQGATLINVKGDGNTLGMFGFLNCTYASVIDLIGCGEENHDIAIKLEDSSCSVNIVGGKYHHGSGGTDLVNISSSGSPIINFIGPTINSYTNVVNDTVRSQTITAKEGSNQAITKNWFWSYKANGYVNIGSSELNASGYDTLFLYDASSFSVTDIDGKNKGKIIRLVANRDDITIVHNVSYIELKDSQDFVMKTGDSLLLFYDGYKWVEIGRNMSPRQTYSATNVTTDRSFDANSTTLDELADVLGTLISDLQDMGIIK